ncbi:MAG: ROK family protein [Nitrospirae bacterium]|nr:ROK family protein [Nitrospirota bacterium]
MNTNRDNRGWAIESIIGVDLGGSTIRLGAVTKDGKLGHFTKIDVPADRDKNAIVSFIVNSIKDILLTEEQSGNRVLAAGIGSPGIINTDKGIIVTSPNFPGWKNVPLKKLIEKYIKIPVFINNDANSAAYGEKWIGAGRRVSSMICLTLGTGIGGGIIIDHKVWHGAQGMGGELGHITVNPEGPLCNCGNYGCLESYSSATGMVRSAMGLINAGKRTKLLKLSRSKKGNITAKMIYDAAKEGDSLSINILREAGKYLGIAIAGFINILNPEMVVLTGEVTGAYEFFFPALREEVEKRAYTAIIRHTKIVRGRLKGTAGTIGASGLAWDKLI